VSSPTPRTVKRTGLILPPQRKLGLAGVVVRRLFYVLLLVVVVLCALALTADRLTLDKGHHARSIEISSDTALVDSPRLRDALEDLHLSQRDVDVWVIAQEGKKLSDVHASVVERAKQEKPDWVVDEHMAPHKLVVFLNITDVMGHADSGLYVGMDLNDGDIDENRRSGNDSFKQGRWNAGITEIVDAQVGRHPLGPLWTGLLWGIGTLALLAALAIALVSRRRYHAAEEQISRGRDALASLQAETPKVGELIAQVERRAEAGHPASGTVGNHEVARRLRSALDDVSPAAAYWTHQLGGFTKARLKSTGAVAQVAYAATNLEGLVARVRGLGDVATMAAERPEWREAACRQADLLEADAQHGSRILDAPSVTATDRAAAVNAAVEHAVSVAYEVRREASDATACPDVRDLLVRLENASSRLASDVARAGNAAAATTRRPDDVVPLLNASASASSGEAGGPTVGRFTTVDTRSEADGPAYPAALGFTEHTPHGDLATQGHRHPGANQDLVTEPVSEQTGDLLNPYVVVPGATAYYLAVKEAGGLPRDEPDRDTSDRDEPEQGGQDPAEPEPDAPTEAR
jgi:hypothetical protein